MTHLFFPLKEISQKEKMIPISHKKKTHLGKSCVTMTDSMVKFCKKTELSDVKCEEFSKSRGLTSKTDFEKQSVLKSPMQLRISLQISNFNYKKTNTAKIKPKLPFQTNIPCPF